MSNTKKIVRLISIDDNAIDQMLIQRLVERSGLVNNFLSFLSAESALKYLESKDSPKVDIVLLDINMPLMDGFEFLEAAVYKLGDKFSKCLVVMLTTSLNAKDLERAENTGIVKEYINKPLTLNHLKELIDSYI